MKNYACVLMLVVALTACGAGEKGAADGGDSGGDASGGQTDESTNGETTCDTLEQAASAAAKAWPSEWKTCAVTADCTGLVPYSTQICIPNCGAAVASTHTADLDNYLATDTTVASTCEAYAAAGCKRSYQCEFADNQCVDGVCQQVTSSPSSNAYCSALEADATQAIKAWPAEWGACGSDSDCVRATEPLCVGNCGQPIAAAHAADLSNFYATDPTVIAKCELANQAVSQGNCFQFGIECPATTVKCVAGRCGEVICNVDTMGHSSCTVFGE